eukprot:Rhum_TRINITY_DN5559_c0_g2::Rhum_TRINITY_DN5559_c0_g2_i1::g.17712::m.17712
MDIYVDVGGAEVCVELDETCRTVAQLHRAVRAAVGGALDVGSFDLLACGRQGSGSSDGGSDGSGGCGSGGCGSSAPPLDDDDVAALSSGDRVTAAASDTFLAHALLAEAGAEAAPNGLVRAACAGDVALCTLFLQAGADPEAPNRFGCTPLCGAAECGRGEVVALLIAAGANPAGGRGCGIPPVHWATYNGHAAIVDALVEAGAPPVDWNVTGRRGPYWSSLMYASSGYNTGN